jgi:crotonobetainyl-CoA:carnitine CoA-transferase CaiB-like acyl-CoA transferase
MVLANLGADVVRVVHPAGRMMSLSSQEDHLLRGRRVVRGSHIELGGVVQPSPAPRFSRSCHGRPKAPREVDVAEMRCEWSAGGR